MAEILVCDDDKMRRRIDVADKIKYATEDCAMGK